MLGPERDSLIVGQVREILNKSKHETVFDDNMFESVKRFEICTVLISRAKNAILSNLEFCEAAAEAYMEPKTDKGIVFQLGETEFEVGYYNREIAGKPGETEERLSLIKDGKERVIIRTFSFADGKVNAHISYSSHPEQNFNKETYYGDKRAVEEADRLIKELQSDPI